MARTAPVPNIPAIPGMNPGVWIMGGGGVSFSNYILGTGGLVARASDHDFPHATVTVTP